MNWFEAYLDEMDVVTILLSKTNPPIYERQFYISDGTVKQPLTIISQQELIGELKYTCKSPFEIDLAKKYMVCDQIGNETDLLIGSVIRTEKFDKKFFYDGNDLGATYTKEKTIFKVWAPTASDVLLIFYEQSGNIKQTYEMVRSDKGVWSFDLSGDCEGFYYRYHVCVNNVWREAVDPYARAVSVNGEYGIVIDLKKTEVPKQSKHLPPILGPTDAIIYETHIRDFSVHPESGVKNKGKYIAFCEENTKGPNDCKTCLDYIVDLGVTHLELLPFNDFGGIDETKENGEYNWGYNPLHYNVPEGSYATDPYDPYVRIRETKEMIEALHRKGIRVIMDVVYNHVYIREQSNFRKIVPGYYFRYTEYGFPSNGTGVGNDIASERLMVRKFIIDSVIYWIKEYNVDGFRFDLMGILDITTMNAIRQAVDEIDPSIIIIGEGWNLNTPLLEEEKATIMNAAKMPRIAHFNDVFRDTVKGSTFHLLERGYISGNLKYKHKLKMLFAGSISVTKKMKGMFPSPSQTVNYVECHDNHTLWDKLAVSNADESVEIRKKRQYLAIAIVLLSQGIPFLHSGIEFFRTKYGEGNSYNKPDYINQLDWARKNMFEDFIPYIKTLIAIRKAHPAFRLKTREEIERHYRWLMLPTNLAGFFLYDLEEIDPWREIIVIFNNGLKEKEWQLPSNELWNIAVQGDQADENGLGQVSQKVLIPPLSTVILFKHREKK